jgi:hypothetical protein
MSFLNSNHAEYLTARITNEGRKAIAKGTFNIEFFQIGDSEFDYDTIFSGLTGTTGQQKVFAPFDNESGVKYPYSLGSDTLTSTTYGTPISNSSTTTLRNEMGSAGFVSMYSTAPTVKTTPQPLTYSKLSGTTSLVVVDGTNFKPNDFITVVLDGFSSTTITGQTNSMIYKVVSKTDNTLTLDRKLPNLTGLTGNVQVVLNEYFDESPTTDIFNPIDYTQQLNSWRLNTVWSDKPIGADYPTNDLDESLSGYNSNQYVSTKQLLGYTKSGQTFTNFVGTTITGTTFKNSFDELVEVLPSEQRCIAIIHYSELGDVTNDPERFFKYDDYISSLTGTTGESITLFGDLDTDDRDYNKTDSDYFEIYIPFINYHRNTGITLGALFTMDTVDYYIKPFSGTTGSRFELKFRYLLDEQTNKVGKVFINNKIVVFDDQELVAMLDYRSNRRYTLPSPKLGSVPSDGTAINSLLPTTGDTVWFTYMFGDTSTSGSTLNALPCNYFNKITGNGTPSQLTFKFNTGAFPNMYTTPSGIKDGFIANKFYALVQTGTTPTTSKWIKIDITSKISGYTSGYIDPTNLVNYTFTITKSDYTGGTSFDLEDHMSDVTTDYLWNTTGSTTQPQFGDEQPFPGSIRLVRATDIEEMNMLINLPSTQFLTSQNPTYPTTGTTPTYITEVALLDSLKEPLVIAKTSTPIKRTGTQVFAIKLDF